MEDKSGSNSAEKKGSVAPLEIRTEEEYQDEFEEISAITWDEIDYPEPQDNQFLQGAFNTEVVQIFDTWVHDTNMLTYRNMRIIRDHPVRAARVIKYYLRSQAYEQERWEIHVNEVLNTFLRYFVEGFGRAMWLIPEEPDVPNQWSPTAQQAYKAPTFIKNSNVRCGLCIPISIAYTDQRAILDYSSMVSTMPLPKALELLVVREWTPSKEGNYMTANVDVIVGQDMYEMMFYVVRVEDNPGSVSEIVLGTDFFVRAGVTVDHRKQELRLCDPLDRPTSSGVLVRPDALRVVPLIHGRFNVAPRSRTLRRFAPLPRDAIFGDPASW